MLKTYLSWTTSFLLLLSPAYNPVVAQQAEQATTAEKTKIEIAKLGVGEKARVTVTLKDGTRTKGYVSGVADNEFLIRDRKTDAPTTVRYADVAKVERNRGHSTAKHLAIGIGIGVGAVVAVLAIVFASLND